MLLFCRLPDEASGEIPAACVVMNSNAEENQQEIMDFIASNVAHYKRVKVLQFVDRIPKSPSGKIMRRLIKEQMLENMNASSKAPAIRRL